MQECAVESLFLKLTSNILWYKGTPLLPKSLERSDLARKDYVGRVRPSKPIQVRSCTLFCIFESDRNIAQSVLSLAARSIMDSSLPIHTEPIRIIFRPLRGDEYLRGQLSREMQVARYFCSRSLIINYQHEFVEVALRGFARTSIVFERKILLPEFFTPFFHM